MLTQAQRGFYGPELSPKITELAQVEMTKAMYREVNDTLRTQQEEHQSSQFHAQHEASLTQMHAKYPQLSDPESLHWKMLEPFKSKWIGTAAQPGPLAYLRQRPDYPVVLGDLLDTHVKSLEASNNGTLADENQQLKAQLDSVRTPAGASKPVPVNGKGGPVVEGAANVDEEMVEMENILKNLTPADSHY